MIRPRIYVEYNDDGTWKPLDVFQCKVENMIGINADWAELSIANNGNKYDHIFDNLDNMEFKVYAGDVSNTPLTTSSSPEEVKKVLYEKCIIHGFAGPASKTQGTDVSNIISLAGGDVCYRINKRFSGDKMFQRTPSQKKRVNAIWEHVNGEYQVARRAATESPYNAAGPLPLLQDIFSLYPHNRSVSGEETPRAFLSKYKEGESPERVNIIVSKKFALLDARISGLVNMDYNQTMTDEDRQDNMHLTKYQVNNGSLLEILDDICVKSGFEAMCVRGTRDIIVYENITELKQMINYIASNPEKFDLEYAFAYQYLNILFYNQNVAIYNNDPNGSKVPLYLNDDTQSPEKRLVYAKMTKYPGYEDGLGLSIAHWDWKKSNQDRAGKASVSKSELVQAGGLFLGNPNPNTNVTYKYEFDPISHAGIRKKTYRAINRLVCNRIEGMASVPSFNPRLIPGQIIKIVDSKNPNSYFSGNTGNEKSKYLQSLGYLVTLVSTSYSSRGFSQFIKFRLPDLDVTDSTEYLEANNFTSVLIRDIK